MMALIVAGIATVVPSLQAIFEQTPAVIDMQQRGRTAVDAIAQSVRAAERVVLLDADPMRGHFRRLMTITRKTNAAQGMLEQDQVGAGGDLVLAPAHCPAIADVCGFVRGTTAVINGNGRFDVFVVGSTDPPTRTIAPRQGFDQPYHANATVLEVDAYTFRLALQPDGSSTLVRDTAAGATQPSADRVGEVCFLQTAGERSIDVTVTLQRQGAPPVESTRRLHVMGRNLP